MEPSTPPVAILELSLISAQDLKQPLLPSPLSLARRLHAYAVVWVDPSTKLRTRTDRRGSTNPTWNDKFLFRVSYSCLDQDSPSAAHVEIYATGLLHDSLLGSVRLLLGNLRLLSFPCGTPSFSALGIRRPSGRLRGILNIAAAILPEDRTPAAAMASAAPALGFEELVRWKGPGRLGKTAPPLGEKNRKGDKEEEEEEKKKKMHLRPLDVNRQKKGKENR